MLHRSIFKGLKNKIHTAVRRNLEEILEVKTFLKMSIGRKCRGSKTDLQFFSFLGCFHFSTIGMDKAMNKIFYVSRRKDDAYCTKISLV